MLAPKTTAKRETIRIGKHLSEIVTITSATGELVKKVIQPLKVELYPHDVMQIIVGATLLAIPVSFTEEVWKLGATLPPQNIFGLMALSLTFMALFVYHNFYQHHFSKNKFQFAKRILTIYSFSLFISFLLLWLIGQASLDYWLISLQRAVIVSLPASMSAAVADMIK